MASAQMLVRKVLQKQKKQLRRFKTYLE